VVSLITHQESTMNKHLRRIGAALSSLVAEDRPGFRHLDVSSAQYDDGSWLTKR
jgi:hypothetical protein